MEFLICLIIFGIVLKALFHEPKYDWDDMDRYTDSLYEQDENHKH